MVLRRSANTMGSLERAVLVLVNKFKQLAIGADAALAQLA